MVGATWTGRGDSWRHAPEDYAAIHFHAGDLDDCRWEPDFAFTVPETLRSGSYMLHLTCAAGEDWLPFYVRPRANGPQASHRLPRLDLHLSGLCQSRPQQRRRGLSRARRRIGAPTRTMPDDYPIYGRSTYNTHPDGPASPSRRAVRPILTMRPGYPHLQRREGSGCAITRPTVICSPGWRTRASPTTSSPTRISTMRASSCWRPIARVLTGSHPEYHTGRMLDALEAYKRRAAGWPISAATASTGASRASPRARI